MENQPIRPIDKAAPIPVYHQIASDLVSRISQGEWKIGDKLPSETILIKEYAVSRVTMRQALSELEERGLLSRQRGRGSFLASNPTPFIENLNFPSPTGASDTRNQNDAQIIEWRFIEEAPLNVQQMFGLKSSQQLILLRRIFSRKGTPIGLSYSWFPAEMVADITSKGLHNNSVSQTLRERYHYKIQKIENYIEAGKLNAEEARLLNSAYDTSVLKIISTHILDTGQPVEYSVTLWIASYTRFKLVVESDDDAV